MNITTERAGIYTSYTASNVSYSTLARGVVGVAAKASSGETGKIYHIYSTSEAEQIFGSGNMTEIIRILFRNGVFQVEAAAAAVSANPTTQNYAAAFGLLAADESVQAIVCDSSAAAVHSELKTAILGADNRNQHKLGVVEFIGTAASAVTAAGNLNCERIVMVSTNGANDGLPIAAAAFAGAVVSEADPAVPMNGAELYGISEATDMMADSTVNTLVRGGVCPVENVGGVVSIVRGVTTYTTDSTWHELTTLRIVDDVIPDVRDTLRSLFARAKNTAQTRDAIRTQVIVVLERKLAAEIIDGYGNVTVSQNEDDPTVCDVTFEFSVAHGINKIVLTANITV